MSGAYERLLDTAERLFSERGYTAVTLRDIGTELGISHASLYYHVPGGKEELFVEVTERSLARHRVGLFKAISQAKPILQEQLRAAARWFLSQPPVDLSRLSRLDLPALNQVQAERLTKVAYESILQPIEQIFVTASEHQHYRVVYPILLASSFIQIIGTIHDADRYTTTPVKDMADEMIAVLLRGIEPRSENSS
ncbi:TetR/AcrR family transcriptional regulator [Aetokthonos hydrillicola Thurmond2011]|jgi:AcrR family transcriptional regulator|uniref:TetR/AcrR family transcriptional regulator n=1 Tax=Aetokthonos hydrillicola Thurmond2011 TaxID=2712845 RepID=A0AAP5MC05_9CYAN|nr:TetR/AcrR family transcriptional regulator [Aetokthonos hydrillicola]MBO3457175.1 TetR/AcrR family transcriptional regulator [Aetokthonos hydrillicola CCALA 1050]MBW4587526.1 TetR/AcrR family transcriptional regulator [Aetokthonos hydrillicola CCALA 1050]MDR9898607.1 TetR/AcrR family transcriptional regulator [Aetokthonos hydrillicola Thurmond2011]